MSSLSAIGFALGGFTIAGGIVGCVKTKSKISLAAGVLVGSLYLASAYRLQSNQPYGIELGLGASAILAAASIPRAIKVKKPVPVTLSVVAITGLLVYYKAYSEQKRLL